MNYAHRRTAIGVTDLLLFLMAAIWGVNVSVIKFATQTLDPVSFTAVRVAIAASVLLSIAAAQRKPWPSRRDAMTLLMLGVLGNGVYQLLFVFGVANTRVATAALVIAAAPGFMAVASRLRGIEHIGTRTALGIGLSILGVAIVIFGSARTGDRNSTFFGALLVFIGMLCWVTFTVFLQPFTRRTDAIQLSALTMLGGVLPMLFAAPPALLQMNWDGVSAETWIAVFYASVVSMVVAYLFWYHGVKVLGPTRTAVYGNLQPAIAILVAWMFLHEIPNLWDGIGTATIMTGLFLTRT